MVADFSLAIALGLIRCEKSMGDIVLGIELGHLLAGKICSVVRDDSMGDPKATYYVLPEELDNLLPADFGERYCLDLFDKVVGGYQ